MDGRYPRTSPATPADLDQRRGIAPIFDAWVALSDAGMRRRASAFLGEVHG
jgi:hypothetical protein